MNLSVKSRSSGVGSAPPVARARSRSGAPAEGAYRSFLPPPQPPLWGLAATAKVGGEPAVSGCFGVWTTSPLPPHLWHPDPPPLRPGAASGMLQCPPRPRETRS